MNDVWEANNVAWAFIKKKPGDARRCHAGILQILGLDSPSTPAPCFKFCREQAVGSVNAEPNVLNSEIS